MTRVSLIFLSSLVTSKHFVVWYFIAAIFCRGIFCRVIVNDAMAADQILMDLVIKWRSLPISNKVLRCLQAEGSVTLDFELAEINAFKTFFPQAAIRGFFFHFTQAIFRHIKGNKRISLPNFATWTTQNTLIDTWRLSLGWHWFLPLWPRKRTYTALIQSPYWSDNKSQEEMEQFLNYF